MVDIGWMVVFVWAQHGYATARNNKEMQISSAILATIPFILTLIISGTKSYIQTLNEPTGYSLILVGIVITILTISWGAGYAIGLIIGRL